MLITVSFLILLLVPSVRHVVGLSAQARPQLAWVYHMEQQDHAAAMSSCLLQSIYEPRGGVSKALCSIAALNAQLCDLEDEDGGGGGESNDGGDCGGVNRWLLVFRAQETIYHYR